MYEQYFSLKTKPFDLVPNPEFMYFSRTHKRSNVYLNYGIRERAGFILLTGEVGSGKTTLIKHMMKHNNEHIKYAKVFNTRADSTQLMAMINDEFGLKVEKKDKILLIKDLNDYLIEQYAKGYYATLIVDEAQNLSADLLEEIRMLSNLETEQSKLLQIILVGQPELRTVLTTPELMQLRQRISISCHIKAMNLTETEEYIYHRLGVAGNSGAIVFEDGVMGMIHEFSRGIPRLINIACDMLMLSAFVEEARAISVEMAQEIIEELNFENQYWSDEAAPIANNEAILLKDQIEHLENEIDTMKTTRGNAFYINQKMLKLENRINNIASKNEADISAAHIKIREMASEISEFKRKVISIQANGETGDCERKQTVRKTEV